MITSIGCQRPLALPSYVVRTLVTTGNKIKQRPPNRGTPRRRTVGARPKLDSQSTTATEILGPYGLRRVDYSELPAKWPLPPPPPASKRATERYFPLLVAATVVVGGVWIYFNQDEQVFEYWREVEKGNVPMENLFGDKDDDDEEDED